MLDGSPKYGLEILANYRWTTLVVDLTESSEACGEWEVVKFRLTVLGVRTFIVTIGNQSSDVIQVSNAVFPSYEIRYSPQMV